MRAYSPRGHARGDQRGAGRSTGALPVLQGIMAAKKKEVTVLTLAEIGVEATSGAGQRRIHH